MTVHTTAVAPPETPLTVTPASVRVVPDVAPERTLPPAVVGIAPPPATPGRRRGRSLVTLGPPAAVFVLFIGAWYAVSYALSPDKRFLVPPPHDVVNVGFLDTANLTQLLRGLLLTSEVAAVGLLIAVVLGVSAGIAMSQGRWVERSLYPWAVVLQTIPILALVPLIGFWFSYGFTSRVVVCVLIALFPIIANTLFGLQSVDAGQRDLFRLHGASRTTVLRKLQLPAALPAMFAGFRISAGLCVVGAIVGDFFFKQGQPGIGILLSLYTSRLQSEQLFAAVILSSLLGVVVFLLFGLLARKVVGAWYEASSGRH